MTTIMRVGLAGVLALLCLGGCGERPDDAAGHDAADSDAVVKNLRKDEAEVMREAAKNRKRFLGDGKARYTPQPVDEF